MHSGRHPTGEAGGDPAVAVRYSSTAQSSQGTVTAVATIRSGDRLSDMVALQRLASRLWPSGGHHPGGLGWALAIDELYPQLQLVFDGEELVGWAGRSTRAFEVHVDPAAPDAVRPLVQWALETAAADEPVSVQLFDGDDAVGEVIATAGFATDPAKPSLYGMFHDAIPVGRPPPAGYRIRGLRPGEERARVEVHRAAWRPATLPWPADVLGTVSPELTSKFNTEKFEAVQRAWLYDPDLDLVVEGPGGTLAGCCTVWWDPSLGVAEVEPLGVLPEHRRRRLAAALCFEAAALVGVRGGHQIFIHTGPRDDYPAPAATYTAIGFSTVNRGTTWTRHPAFPAQNKSSVRQRT
jgi:ribosomal protein S18 acetylase RimI-like enzyme